MSDDRFRTLIRDLHVGVVVQGPRAEILISNRAALELLGLTESQFLGRTSFDPTWEIVHEDGMPFPGHDRPVATAIATRQPVRNVVMGIYRPRTKDRVWLLVNAEPELGEDGAVTQVVATLADITELKRLEASLLQAQKLESLGRLAGGVAHDFNNLLTVIISCSELALSKLPPDSPARGEIKESIAAAMRGAGLTRQLLTFARKQAVSPRVVRVGAVLADLQGLLARMVGVTIEISTSVADDVRPTRIDQGQLEQVLINLAINARDAMPDGGKLRIDASNVTVDGEQEVPPGEYVRIEISDTGHGIDASTRARLFEPFFTTKELGRGTGLGLATAQGIVERHGGRITVESEVGRGTTFRIYLRPCEPVAVASPAASAPLADRPARVSTILIAEDDPRVRAVGVRALSALGHVVLEAGDGAAAEAAARAHGAAIDLVIADVVMPKMNGPRLVAALRAEHPNLRALFVSGYADDPPPASEGDFLPKPFAPEALVAAARALLDR